MSLILGLLLIQPSEEAIIITGRGLPDEPPGQHRTILARDDLDSSASGRMEDVIRSVAGLTSFRRSDSRSSHPTAQGLTARGLGGNAASRFAVEVDGVPQADPFGGWINFVALDPLLIDRAILSRGGQGGVRFGQGAVAGTLAIDSLSGIEGRLSAGLAYGSRDAVSLHGASAIAVGKARLVGGAHYQRGDGFAPIVENDRGSVDRRAPYQQASGRVRLIAPVAGMEVQASLSGFTDRRDRGVGFTDNHGSGLDAALRLVGRDFALTGYHQWRRFESEFASVGAGRDNVSPALDQYEVPASGWGARASWQPRFSALGTALGVDIRGTEGKTNERYLFNAGVPQRERHAQAETLTYGLFADADWRTGGTLIGIGARIDRWQLRGASLSEANIGGSAISDVRYPDRDGHQWSLRAGIDQRVGQTATVRAAAYRAWRMPTINELVRPFRVGPDATAANAALEPERLVGVEAGLDWRPDNAARLSITAFANRLHRAIANVTLGEGPGIFPGVGFVAAGGRFRRRENLSSIRAIGIELDGEWSRGPWTLGGSLAITDARIDDHGLAMALDGERPAQVPAFQGTLRLQWVERERLAALTLRTIGKQDENEGDDEALPGAVTLDAVTRWPIRNGLALDLRAENLFDRRVISSILTDGTRERAMPRSLWIGLRFN